MKTETIAEFLARGGKITKVAEDPPAVKAESIKSTSSGGPAVIMSMGEADLYYGEHKPRKAKAKAKSTMDLSALPPELRKKYVDDIINVNKEADEDEQE
jgi:hypothetical protein